MNYWRECVEVALEEAGIKASEEQIQIITDTVEGGFENYGMAHGHGVSYGMREEANVTVTTDR